MTGPLVIYCDASAPHPKATTATASGWGAVFVRNGKALAEASGAMPPMESVVAEFKAVRYALEHALREGLCACETVIVASDCDSVEKYLTGQVRSARVELAALAEGIRRVSVKAKLTLVATWVKGHRPGAAVHGRHNARADRLAKVASGARLDDAALAAKRAEAHRLNEEKMRRESLKAAEARRQAKEERKRAADPANRMARVHACVERLEGRS